MCRMRSICQQHNGSGGDTCKKQPNKLRLNMVPHSLVFYRKMDTWEMRGKMGMVDNSNSIFGLKLGQNNLRTEINFQSMVPLSTLTLYAKQLDYYGRDVGKSMSILAAACLENPEKIHKCYNSQSISHHQDKQQGEEDWRKDEECSTILSRTEKEKINVKEVSSDESTWFWWRWIHRLFDLTCSLLGGRWNNSWEEEEEKSNVTGGESRRCDTAAGNTSSARTAGRLKNSNYSSSRWLRNNPLLYPSELHYVGRTILIATITTEVLVQTVQRLNLDFNQLVTNSGVQLICLTGLLGIYKEFHLFWQPPPSVRPTPFAFPTPLTLILHFLMYFSFLITMISPDKLELFVVLISTSTAYISWKGLKKLLENAIQWNFSLSTNLSFPAVVKACLWMRRILKVVMIKVNLIQESTDWKIDIT